MLCMKAVYTDPFCEPLKAGNLEKKFYKNVSSKRQKQNFHHQITSSGKMVLFD